ETFAAEGTAIGRGLVRLGADDLLGLLRLDIFSRRRPAACQARVAEFFIPTDWRNTGSRRLDALDRSRAWVYPLAEFARRFFEVVAAALGAGFRRGLRLRVCCRALIYPAALRALHLFPVLDSMRKKIVSAN